MKSGYLGSLIVLLASAGIVSCASTPKTAKVEANWINTMHKLSNSHLSLMPYAADSRKFSDPANREEIKRTLKLMVDGANAIVTDNKAPNADPIIQFTAAKFASEAKQAYTAFEVNDHQWSRFAINRMSGYCISCHTRADRGVKDFQIGWTSELSALTPVQNVEFLLANRRYSSAMAAAKKLASDSESAQRDPRTWVLTIQRALGMAVRVNKEPAQAASLASLVVKNKSAPQYIRRDASAWFHDIGSWQKEERGTRRKADLKNVVKIVDRAQKLGPRNEAALVHFLRASGMVHELLENSKSKTYGETLFYAGIIADALRELNMGNLDQYYYESCINNEPHSELAERCYTYLEASVRASNPLLAMDTYGEWEVSSRLATYRKLAEVKDILDDPRWDRRFWEDFYQFDQENEKNQRRNKSAL